MNQDKLLAYCERKNTYVLDRKGNKVILENGEILEIDY